MSDPFKEAIQSAVSQKGTSLYDLSFEGGVMVAFLRDFGCTFCRETVAEMVRLRRPFEQKGIRIAFAHLGAPGTADIFFEKYGAGDVHHFADPDHSLYDAFELRQLPPLRVFGPRALGRLLTVLPRYGHGLYPDPAPLQKPGIFILYRGKIEKSFPYQYVSDKPDYLDFSDCEACSTESAVAT